MVLYSRIDDRSFEHFEGGHKAYIPIYELDIYPAAFVCRFIVW